MIGPCAICHRQIRAGYGFSPSKMKPVVWTCSSRCAAFAEKLYGKDDLMTELEKQARQDAGKVAGGYLDKIGKAESAIGDLTPEEWNTFLDALFETYHERLIELSGGNKAPF